MLNNVFNLTEQIYVKVIVVYLLSTTVADNM